MAKYRKIPVVVEATQWFKGGDHPVVRHFSHPAVQADKKCSKCGHVMNVHGWIDTLTTRAKVCELIETYWEEE